MGGLVGRRTKSSRKEGYKRQKTEKSMRGRKCRTCRLICMSAGELIESALLVCFPR